MGNAMPLQTIEKQTTGLGRLSQTLRSVIRRAIAYRG
jgi:hypothetical protein